MTIKLEREERPNGEVWYNLFKDMSCEGIYKEIGPDALKDLEGKSVAQGKAERAYKTLVALHSKGPTTTILLSTEI